MVWFFGPVIGPFFFEDDEGVTVNGERYRHMVTSLLRFFLQNIVIQNLRFQRCDATCHASCETIDVIDDKFSGRLISSRGDQEWSARNDVASFYGVMSCHKSYANKSRTIRRLKAEIKRAISDVTLDERVVANHVERICRLSGDGHMPDIVFPLLNRRCY